MLLLDVSTVILRTSQKSLAYLKLVRQKVHVATVFIIGSGVAPDVADLFFEGIPCLELCDAGDLVTATDAFRLLCYLLKRHRMLDDFVVVLQLACWQICKWRVDLQASE